jgi:hypothetical protein
VDIAIGYELDGLGSIPGSALFFYSPLRPDRYLGPPSLSSNRYRGSFVGVKWPESDVEHSPPSSAEAKNGGAIPPLPVCLHGIALN